MHITFLSAALTFMVIYVWSRKNPLVLMNFLGFVNFHAPYMPFVLLGFSFLISGTIPKSDALGILVGHVYYYLHDVVPRVYGKRPLQTPRLLQKLFGQEDEAVVVIRRAAAATPTNPAEPPIFADDRDTAASEGAELLQDMHED